MMGAEALSGNTPRGALRIGFMMLRARWWWFWGCWLCACGLRAGDDVALVALPDRWRYLAVGALAEPPVGWQSEAFDDSGWWEGPGGFGTTYYGESTRFPNTNGWERVLLRRAFVMPEGADVRWLSLRVDYSGGFVLSLNGREWIRRGFSGTPDVPVPLSAVPAPRSAGSPELIPMGSAVGWIRPGTNWVSLQLHGDASTSSSRWPLFTGEILANFSRAPYLQHVSSNRAEIRCLTPWPRSIRVDYGVDLIQEASAGGPEGTNHVVRLEGLRPGTRYRYRVVLGGDGSGGATAPLSFRTLPVAGPLTVQVLGDSGWGDFSPHAVVDRMMRTPADLVLHVGDLVYPGFSPALADHRFLSVQRPWMRTRASAFSWGNHELYHGFAPLVEIFGSPTNDTPDREHEAEKTVPQAYYSFDAGDVHVAVLFQPFLGQYQMRTDSPQARWLDRDLAMTRKPWKVVMAHIPWETSSVHRFDDSNYNLKPDGAEFAEVLLPVARRHGVQLFLSGHDHNYERLIPFEGMTSIVTGGGGAMPYGLREVSVLQSVFRVVYHFTELRFEGDTLSVRCINPQGQVEDQSIIRRVPDPAPSAAAAAGGPEMPGPGGFPPWEAHGLSRAPAISAMPGRFSNLGRLRVAMDAEDLHLGIDGLAISQGSDVYLFLEVPGLPGVASLAGLGDGRRDVVGSPTAQGVDALDLADGVAFEGFRPSVAVVVGDVTAQRPDRWFRRPRSEMPLGHGVFRLDPGLTSIPGGRLTAWNPESVRGVVPPMVSSAHSLRVSIPRSALGGLRWGQTLRLAVGVGLEMGSGATSRRFDAGFIGGSGPATVGERPVFASLPVILPAAPAPRLQAGRTADGQLELRWDGVAGEAYRIEATEDLGKPFDAWLEIPSRPEDAPIGIRMGVGPEPRFFRVRAR